MHAEGNFQFYDPISCILFSGDLGASFGTQLGELVSDFAAHQPRMQAFHSRYMVSNKVLRMWAQMVRGLDIAMFVPQHGAPLVGAAVTAFIDWVETLSCGIGLMSQANYAYPPR